MTLTTSSPGPARSPVDPHPASERGGSEDPADVARRVVPWSTVLPLAIVLAYTNGFWVVALRGAVGSIERTRGPFLSWLLESALVVPLFTLVVMVTLTRARRRLGPHPHRARPVARAGLMVAGAATGVGALVLVANAWLDEHLQLEHIEQMGSMGGSCFAECREAMTDANLALQLQAVGWGSLLLVVSNIVVVGWVLAVRGWQLRLLPRDDADVRAAGARTAERATQLLLALGLLGAGAIHAAVVADHLEEWWVAGAFFVLLAVAQLAAAGLVLLTPHRTTLWVVAVVSLGPLVLWLVSRTVGIPVGPEPWEPEGLGLADLACAGLEQVTLLLAVGRLRGSGVPDAHEPASWRLAVVGLVTLTTLGLGSGFGVLGQGHQHGDDDEPTFDWAALRDSQPRPAGAP